ncbi:Dimethylaniline monooxygenase [N-oxide-forming] 5 [Sciurus carolinensis]|uniref:Flavin-containing monooxygenase n=1 Tax=Sciurus carolinensis TaxID=30640 RepID=A0AA41NF79_SCICA|nr:Dimethylaniline monooxygenase [N-oxide-forming] 5 [Sciurus carolinensis]
MTKKRIAVIGSESCRLSSVKWCLDEGRESVCFERTDDIGGLCRYLATVYSLKKRPYFSTSGQWEAVIECEGKKEVNVFDGVMLCTGHHSNAHLPLESFPGIGTFKGQYFHSQDYKNLEALAGKRVFIIVRNSGGDMVIEISYTAKQATLQLFWGPCTPLQFHLHFPGKWNGVQKTILTTDDHIRKPVKTRVIEKSNSIASTKTRGRFMLPVIFFEVIMAYF